MDDLKGKVALVTGSAQGIGKATAQLLCEHGATCVIADLNLPAAEKTAAEFKEMGLSAVAMRLDVASPDSITEVIDQIGTDLGGVDILINNAGIISDTPLPELTVEQWDRTINIDLRGAHLCAQAACRQMIKKQWGRIVFIGSLAGQVGGLKVGPDYSASKAGAICLAKSYARYGARQGITANAVCPGLIETPMTAGRDDPNEVLMGRLGTPEDIAKAIYFLVSDLSDYITGATIDVNGGHLMR